MISIFKSRFTGWGPYLNLFSFVMNSGNLSKCLIGKIVDFLSSWCLKSCNSFSLGCLSSCLNLLSDLVLLIDTYSFIPNTILIIKLLDYEDESETVSPCHFGYLPFDCNVFKNPVKREDTLYLLSYSRPLATT